jgi:hypothetical protein
MNYKKKDSGLSETKNGKADLLDKPTLKNGEKILFKQSRISAFSV